MPDDSQSETRALTRDTLSTVTVVTAIDAVPPAVSGAWPPMVVVESGSMQPILERGDFVVMIAEVHYDGPAADGYGIVTANTSEGCGQLGGPGDVAVYDTPSCDGPPIIHRAAFWVENGENWYDWVNLSYVDGLDPYAGFLNCPASHAGCVVRGDDNGYCDQAQGITSSVRPDWMRTKDQLHVPYLGELWLGVQKLL